MNADRPSSREAEEFVPLIQVEDEEVVIEHHFEDWLALIIFWSLGIIVFVQFFTRYVLNDSLAWTEEIARYLLMSVTFIGGAIVTRKQGHIAVDLLANLMRPSLARSLLMAVVDIIKLTFLGLLAYFSVLIVERMHYQRMTVFDLPMSLVYGGVALGCFLMFGRQLWIFWCNARQGWRTPPDPLAHASAD